MKQLRDMAYASRNNPKECTALYIELLEGHIQQQDRLLETFRQELDEVINLLERSKS